MNSRLKLFARRTQKKQSYSGWWAIPLCFCRLSSSYDLFALSDDSSTCGHLGGRKRTTFLMKVSHLPHAIRQFLALESFKEASLLKYLVLLPVICYDYTINCWITGVKAKTVEISHTNITILWSRMLLSIESIRRNIFAWHYGNNSQKRDGGRGGREEDSIFESISSSYQNVLFERRTSD